MQFGQTEQTKVITEEIKAQPVRLLDVALFGPLMIMGALDKNPPKWMKLAVLLVGVGTMVYNLNNWIQIQKQKELAEKLKP